MKKVYDLARLEIGTYEWAEGSNPRVDAYFDDVGYLGLSGVNTAASGDQPL